MNTLKSKSMYKLSALALLLALIPSLTTLAQGYGPYGNGGGYYNQGYGYNNGGGCNQRNGYGQGYGYNNGYGYGNGNGGYYPNTPGTYGPAYGYPPRPQVVVVTPPPPPVVVAPPTVIVQRPPVVVARPWGWGGGNYAHRPRFYGGGRW